MRPGRCCWADAEKTRRGCRATTGAKRATADERAATSARVEERMPCMVVERWWRCCCVAVCGRAKAPGGRSRGGVGSDHCHRLGSTRETLIGARAATGHQEQRRHRASSEERVPSITPPLVCSCCPRPRPPLTSCRSLGPIDLRLGRPTSRLTVAALRSIAGPSEPRRDAQLLGGTRTQ